MAAANAAGAIENCCTECHHGYTHHDSALLIDTSSAGTWPLTPQACQQSLSPTSNHQDVGGQGMACCSLMEEEEEIQYVH